MNYIEYKDKVLAELNEQLSSFDERIVDQFVEELANKRCANICAYGAGRMGYGLRAFIMRLIHLGYHAYWYTDTTIPHMGPDDMFLFSSASGKTQTVVKLAEIAKEKTGTRIVSVTGDAGSPLAQLSDLVIKFKGCNNGLNAENSPDKINSIQPMTTLNEQTAFIFFDLVSLKLMERLNEDNKTMSFRHNIIE